MSVVPDPSPQPNLVEDSGTFPAMFWLLVVMTGIGAGLGGAGLMRLLYAVQHVAWNYETGTFLAAVTRTTAKHRFLVLVGAGLIAGVSQRLVRHSNKGHAGDLTEALANRAGEMPTLPTFAGALVSIVIVGMGASLVTRLFERRAIYTVRVAPADPGTGQTAVGELSTQAAN